MLATRMMRETFWNLFSLGNLLQRLHSSTPTQIELHANILQEAHETIEVYRPKFEVVSTVNDLRSVKTKRGSILTAPAAIVLVGAGAAAVYLGGKAPKELLNISLQQLKSLLPRQVSMPSMSGGSGGSGGFWKGFAVATLVNGVAAVLGFHRLEQLFDIQNDFRKYAAYKIAPAAVYASKTKKAKTEPVLHPQQYRKFPLVRKDTLSPNVYRLVFALPRPQDILGLPTGQHVAIRADIDGKMVSRSYTPTSNNSDLGRLELVVKVYPGGLITNYLASLKSGDLVEFRGPKGAMKYHRDLTKHLGMIAGGTGITPMYQLIRHICEDPKDNTKVTLLYGNQTESDILLRQELDGFQRKYPHKFSVWYVLGSAPAGWQYGTGFVTKDVIKEKLAVPATDSKVHLCGPPPMINAMKKALVELGYEAPSPLSKATDQIFLY